VTPDCSNRRFGIVAARFYADLAEEMVAGAMDALRECNVAPEDITVSTHSWRWAS
jgi:6,7-dimethyl-8-ribityllumazine synthase